MIIHKIKPEGFGFKGLYVEYTEIEAKTGKISDINKRTYKRPIQMGLQNKFNDLREYLLQLCELLDGSEEDANVKYAVYDTKVTAIKIDGDGFVIIGEKTVFGNKKIKLETCTVTEEDEYVNFEKVQGIIKEIVEETTLYMQNKVVLDNEELVTRYVQAGQDKSMSAENYNTLSTEDKREYHRKMLEEVFGDFVMQNENLDVSEVSQEQIEAVEQEFEAKAEEIIIDPTMEEIVIPAPKKKEKKAVAPKILKLENEVPEIANTSITSEPFPDLDAEIF